MKTLRTAGAILLVLAALLGFGALTAAAQAPSGLPYFDNQPHVIDPTASLFYRFDYGVSDDPSAHPLTTITLVNGTNSGLGFSVWTGDTVGDIVDNKPVGQGTTSQVDCTTGAPTGAGGCQSPDLTWSGAFGSDGPYYVVVTNSNNSSTKFALQISGTGVSLGPQKPVVAAPPAAAPKLSAPAAAPATAPKTSAPAAAPALAAVNMDDPAKATPIDAAQHTVPANSGVWYRFDYALNDDGSRPTKLITLVNGNRSGVSFQVWTPDIISDWFDNKPIGVGTPLPLDCDSGQVSGSGGCQSSNLTWQGAFGESGTYYVRVVNNSNSPVQVALTIQ